MFAEFQNLVALFDYFKDEETCHDYLVKMRFPKGMVCPHCGHDHIYNTKRTRTDGTQVKGFKCGNSKCYKKFTITTGTYMESSKIDLRLWFGAFYLCSSNKKSVSSVQLGKHLGCSQKTAWFMLMRIRASLGLAPIDKLSGVVEVDETYIGKNGKGGKHGRAVSDKKTAVFGMVERGGRVRAMPVKDLTKLNLTSIVKQNVEHGAIVFTDELKSYNALSLNYFHQKIHHNGGEFARGMVHTNSIEGFWSQLKRQIMGTHHWVSQKHLGFYVDECGYKWNSRGMNDPDRFSGVLTHLEGRLRYQVLTGAKPN